MTETSQSDEMRAKQELLANLLSQGRRTQAVTSPSAPVAQHAAPPTPVAQPAPPYVAAAPPRKRSQPVASTRDDPFDTAILDHTQVDRVAVNAVRALAYVILVLSFFGSVLAFNGDWQPSWTFWRGIQPIAAVVGIALQIEITLVEWWRGARWRDPVYVFHLALDTILTFMGFWPLLGQPFLGALQLVAVTLLTWTPQPWLLEIVSRVLFVVGCMLAARLPEIWLVRRPKLVPQVI